MAQHWSHFLRSADTAQPLFDAEVEPQDEQQWGQQRPLHFVTTGTGPQGLVIPQLVQATRPARVWSVTLAFSVLGVADMTLLHAPNAAITATFILQLGVGQTMVKRYVQLFDTDLVAFAPDVAFPLRVDTPIASVTLPSFPAKQVLIAANVKYDRILLAGNANLDVLVSAEVAPVYR